MDRPEDRLALIELTDRDGRPQRLVDVFSWPLTLGRALGDTVVIDDPHVAPAHARLEALPDGRLELTVGDSVNGVWLDGRRLGRGERSGVPAGGALLQLGGVRVRLRLPGEALAPEQPLAAGGAGTGALALMALLLIGALAGTHALSLDADADFTAWLPVLPGAPLMLVGWCAAWALGSKLFRHRFDFWGHAAIALPWLLAIEAVDLLQPQLAAMLSWPALWQATPLVAGTLGAFLLRAHVLQVFPGQARRLGLAVLGLAAAGGVIAGAVNQRQHDRLTAAPYMSTLPLPALRLAPAVPVQSLVDEMAALREPLAERVRQARREDTDAPP